MAWNNYAIAEGMPVQRRDQLRCIIIHLISWSICSSTFFSVVFLLLLILLFFLEYILCDLIEHDIWVFWFQFGSLLFSELKNLFPDTLSKYPMTSMEERPLWNYTDTFFSQEKYVDPNHTHNIFLILLPEFQ